MRLSVQIEFDKTLDLDTNKSSVVVGRSPQADLVIPHDGISRQHCKIDFDQGRFYITDLGSSNGVFLDGERLAPQKKVAFLSSQQLRLGILDCEVMEFSPEVSEHTIISSQLSSGGNYTATIRLARLDLNRPSRTLELEKMPKKNRPRNPVVAQFTDEVPVESSHKKPFIILLMILILAAAWYFSQDPR